MNKTMFDFEVEIRASRSKDGRHEQAPSVVQHGVVTDYSSTGPVITLYGDHCNLWPSSQALIYHGSQFDHNQCPRHHSPLKVTNKTRECDELFKPSPWVECVCALLENLLQFSIDVSVTSTLL